MKARVLLVENSGSFLGGGQVSFINLIERLDRSRYEPYVVCPDEGDFVDRVLERGIPAFIQPMPSLRGWGWLSCLRALRSWLGLLRRFRIDLVHANGSRAMIYAGLAGKLFSLPVLWHVRVLGNDEALDRLLARLSVRVVVNSRAVACRFDFLSRGPRERRPHVIPNGVDVDAFAAARPDPGLSRDWRAGAKHLLVVLAQLIPWKRQDLAITILWEVRRRGIDAGLVLVGDELPASRGYRSRLEALTRKLHVVDHCVFAGFRRDIPAILKIGEVLIHPAKDEPFGRALIEAMAAGLPVVAAAGGGVEEVIENGVTGIALRSEAPAVWADTIEELLMDPSLCRRMGGAGQRLARERFSMEMHLSRVQALYEEVLSRSP